MQRIRNQTLTWFSPIQSIYKEQKQNKLQYRGGVLVFIKKKKKKNPNTKQTKGPKPNPQSRRRHRRRSIADRSQVTSP